MNSDNYEFSKSSAPQSVSDYSAFSDKQWNYVNDINSGVYNTSGQSLVQFDLSSVYNSNGFCDVSDLYLAIPLVMVATCTAAGGAPLAVPTAGVSLCALKSNYQHLIHQIEVVANGKVVNDMQPFVSMYKNFKLLSQLSATDLQSIAPSLGMSNTLDNEKSAVFTTANLGNFGQAFSTTGAGATPASFPGVSLCTNLPFSISGSAPAGIALGQNRNQSNKAIYDRTSKIIDQSQTLIANCYQNIYSPNSTGLALAAGASAPQPCIMSTSNITAEFKSYYASLNNISTWYDIALIPLKYICDCIDKMGLVKKMDLVMRFYVNTGAIQINVENPNTATLAYGSFTSSFGTTCPLTINYLPATSANGGIPATTTLITAGLFVGKTPTTMGSTAITIGTISHSMAACRCYYSTVQLEPSKAVAYIEANIAKEIIYENFLFNQYSTITAGGTFSQLVQSGIKNPIGICIIPLISPTNSFPSVAATTVDVYPLLPLNFSQYASPYDPCPASYAPISLTNLQVTLGGSNVMNTSMYYTYENFLEQISLAENLTSADIGISAGLLSQSWWEMNRVYWVDLGRGQEADKATSRNLNISFVNNSQVVIDVMVFTVYLDRFVLNVLTGQVKK